ncbi:MAG: CRISPR-associated endonuclease Cas2 [Lachnospiraceae bacterium]|nr:CRISPR-associated endonuclease Cas2 [Lachnospiraceae bacterium]
MAFYVISYDISKTKTRNKVAKLLEGYGRRIQYSVFECEIEEASYARLYEKLLKQTLESGTDSICIYRLCKKCAGDVVTIGTARQGAASLKESAIIV